MKLVLAAAVLAAVLAVPTALAGTPTLVGTVGVGFVISLKENGTKVTHLRPGKYVIVVHDKAVIHDFHLRGPGVNKATSINNTAEVTWHVTLTKGTYTYVCDPHKSFMKGSFTVS